MTVRRRVARTVFVVILAAALAACGTSASPSSAVPADVLPVAALPGLPAVTHPLSALDVSKDSTIASLAGWLQGQGYLGGWERTFQGESRRLTLVVSRSLTFRDSAGAGAFVRYLRDHVAGFYPFALVRPLAPKGDSGWIFDPPECACHMANPYLVGVKLDGRQVAWLEINGPDATSQALRSLLTEIPWAGTSPQQATTDPASMAR